MGIEVDRWPETGYVKKLQRRDGCFYYYNRQREYSEVANRIIKERRLAEQRLSEQAITRGRENGDEKTPGDESSVYRNKPSQE